MPHVTLSRSYWEGCGISEKAISAFDTDGGIDFYATTPAVTLARAVEPILRLLIESELFRSHAHASAIPTDNGMKGAMADRWIQPLYLARTF